MLSSIFKIVALSTNGLFFHLLFINTLNKFIK